MIRYLAPACPWNEDKPATIPAEVVAARSAIKEAVERGDPKLEFEEVWQRYKPVFREAQGEGKCGWCEERTTDSPGAIEHHAPKGGVTTFCGRRTENPITLYAQGGRYPPDPDRSHGYWERAYMWDNWALVCSVCNSGWKRNLFPRDGSGAPLLLFPFDLDVDPEDHLDLREDGTVVPRDDSTYGRATIDTMGLDRPSLVWNRDKDVATRVVRWCKQWIAAVRDNEAVCRRQNAENIIEACKPRERFAAQARAMVRAVLGCYWTEFRDAEQESVQVESG